MEFWTELSDDVLDGAEYTNAERGWRNTETDAEVIVFKVGGTGLEDVTDKEWGVQHPIDDDDENTTFFESHDGAVAFAEEYVQENTAPENTY
jgi:hypothetical protein